MSAGSWPGGPQKGLKTMTPEQISNLEDGDRLMALGLDKAEVVRRTPQGVMIRWEDGEEKFYGLEDPALKNLTYIGFRQLGEPWLTPKRPKRR